MKKALRIVCVISLLALYSAAVAVVHHQSFVTTSWAMGHAQDGSSLSALAFKLVSHKAQAEQMLSGGKAATGASFAHSLISLAAQARTINDFFQSSYTRYLINTRSLLVRSRKEDFLFPFHYDW